MAWAMFPSSVAPDFLRGLKPKDFDRTFIHPENGELTLGLNVSCYAWHGKHHVAHITALREREGWHAGRGGVR